MHTRMHRYTHHIHMLRCMCVHIIHICMRVHTYAKLHTAHTHAWVRTLYTHAHVYTLHPHVCIHYTHIHVCTHAHVHMFTCTCACSHVHTITRVHAHLFTYILFSTYSHAHPHPPCRMSWLWPSGPAATIPHGRFPLPPHHAGQGRPTPCLLPLGHLPQAPSMQVPRSQLQLQQTPQAMPLLKQSQHSQDPPQLAGQHLLPATQE